MSGVENPGALGKPTGSRAHPAVRISDPVDRTRPTGRPRKIPRSGLPEGLTPSQLAKYRQSQQAAARYQKMKAEKEISRRISDGEDPLIVRQNVYSELCAGYVEAGEEVPPILKCMMDQELSPSSQAHEPNPSPPGDSREVHVELQDPGFSGEEFLSYLPSIAAHTQQVLPPPSVQPTGPIIQGKETSGPPEDSAPKPYNFHMPSVAAHSRPYLTSWYLSLDIPVLNSQRTRSRPIQHNKKTMLKSLTLETTPTEIDQVIPALPSDSLNLKRKRSSSNISQVGELPGIQYLPSTAAHTQQLVDELEFSLVQPDFNQEDILPRPGKKQRVDGGARKFSIAPKSRTLKEKTYEELSRSIMRDSQGVFVGEHALRARAKGQRGRTKYTRLAIFQSARLNEFTWFLKQAENPERSDITTAPDDQDNLPYAAASSSNSPSMAGLRPSLPLVPTSSQSPPDPGSGINRNSSSNVTPHLDQDQLNKNDHMIPEMGDDGDISNEAIYNRSHDISSPRTSTPGAGEATRDLQVLDQAVPDLAPSISGFTPINKAGIGRATKITDAQKPVDPKIINHGGTLSRRLSEASFKVSPIAPPQSIEEFQGDGTSEVDRSPQEPEVIGATLEVNESEERSIDPRDSQEPEPFSPNEPTSSASPPKPLDTVTKSSTLSQSTQTYPNRPDISEFAPVLVSERPPRERSENTLDKVTSDSPEGNRMPMQGSSSRSIGSDLSTPSKAVSSTRTRKLYQSTSLRQVAAGGGSVGVLRRKIIMDIIESCGGVYPGVRELLSPFTTAWMKLDRSGRPDARTVQTAFNYLVSQSCKLRPVTFSFKTAKGVMVTKTLATLIDISPTDPKVIDMQKNIASAYPGYYFPPEAEFTEETRSSGSYLTRYGRHTSVKDLEFEKEDQVQLQHKPAFDVRLEQKQARAEMRSELSKAKNMEARAARLAETGLLVRIQFLPNITGEQT